VFYEVLFNSNSMAVYSLLAVVVLIIANFADFSTGLCATTYTVVSGDTCSGICAKEGISLATLYANNPSIDNPACDNLEIGEVLCINECTKTYTVKSGDTCNSISSGNGITLNQFYSWNAQIECSSCEDIEVGQVVCVGISASTSAPTTRAATTHAPTTHAPTTHAATTAAPSSWPIGPVKAIYIDDSSSITTAVADASAAFNLIIIAFYLHDGAGSSAHAWEGSSSSSRTSALNTAHANGAKVLVSGTGAGDNAETDDTATSFGQAIANFANSYGLDGVDFDLENFGNGFVINGMSHTATVSWITTATNEARSILGSSKIITHAPEAAYFGSGGYGNFAHAYYQVYTGAPTINYFLIQYYNEGTSNNLQCYLTYESIFVNSNSDCPDAPGTSISEIHALGIPLSKLVVGKPVDSGDATWGYVSDSELHSYVTEASSNLGWNSGVMGWEWHTNSNTWINTIYPSK